MTRDAQIIAAVSPGPWAAVPLAGGMTATTFFFTPASRQWLDMVQLSGSANGTFPANTATTLGTLVAQFRPGLVVAMSAVAFTSAPAPVACSVQISTAGVISVDPAAAATSVRLDGLSYRLV